MKTPYYKPPEIAKILRVAHHTVLGWINSGQLAATNVASRPDARPSYRVSPEALEAFQAKRAVEPVAVVRQPKCPADVPGIIKYV